MVSGYNSPYRPGRSIVKRQVFGVLEVGCSFVVGGGGEGVFVCFFSGWVWVFVAFHYGFWNVEDFYLWVYKCGLVFPCFNGEGV